jgi:hypothetical protein
MYILVTEHETLLDVPGIFLTTENGYDPKGSWNLEAEIP